LPLPNFPCSSLTAKSLSPTTPRSSKRRLRQGSPIIDLTGYLHKFLTTPMSFMDSIYLTKSPGIDDITAEMTWGKTPRKLANETTSVFCPHVHSIVGRHVSRKRATSADCYTHAYTLQVRFVHFLLVWREPRSNSPDVRLVPF